MLRAFCSEWDGTLQVPVLSRDELHHLIRVRRVRKGESIEILNGKGDILCCTVEQVGAKNLDLSPVKLNSARQDPVRRHMLVAMPKGKTFPNLLQKAVELGVAEITPLMTQHSEVDQDRVGRKSDRWDSVLVEAVKQSGNPWLPILNPPIGLKPALDGCDPDELRLCAALQPDARPLLEVLEEFCPERGVVKVFVGPEGDFSEEEYQELRDGACRFFTLGTLVLKVETAASLAVGSIGIWCQGRDVEN